MGCPSPQQLPTAAEYVAQLRAAGFTDVAFADATPRWRPWVAARAEAYREDRARNVRVQGEAITEGMEVFYDTVARLFAGGRLGGCVVTAQGRWSDRELAEAELQSLE